MRLECGSRSHASLSVFLILAWLYRSHLTGAALAGESCPSSCFCDEIGNFVSCFGGDGLWQIPDNIPRSTSRLKLQNFVLPTLTSDNLAGLKELRELAIQQARISTIEVGSFLHLNNLVRLDLAQNEIENITDGIFDGLKGLRNLDLSSNWLVNIDEGFEVLNKVEELNLRGNRLRSLNSRSFVGLEKVVTLNLDYNLISIIEVGAFQYLVNLAHLIISNNPLKTLSRLDFFGSRLQFIDMSNITLERVPQSLTKFIRDLRLAKNNLTRLMAGDFDSYPYLGLLVLADNAIEDIENDALGRQEYLLRLWLNGNRLTRVPANLPPSLRALYMEENQLETLHPYSFKGLTNLEQLFLQRNRILNLSACAFCDLANLTSLDLQGNRIEHLVNGVFTNLGELQMLDISQNNIRVLADLCFAGLESLKVLKLSRMPANSTVQFNESIFDNLKSIETLEMYDSAVFAQAIFESSRVLRGLRRIQELNIMHNKLTNLRPDFPSFFPLLKIIKMGGNLWHCSRKIIWLTNWIKMSNVQFDRSYSIRCASPQELYYKPIMLLHEEDFNEAPTPSPAAATDTYDTSITSIATFTSQTEPVRTTIPPKTITNQHIELSVTVNTNVSDVLTTLTSIQSTRGTETSTEDQMTTSSPMSTDSTTSVASSGRTAPPELTIFPGFYSQYNDTTRQKEELTSTTPAGQTFNRATKDVSKATTFQERVQAHTLDAVPAFKNQRIFFNRKENKTQTPRFYVSALGRGSAKPSGNHWNQMTAITVSTALAGGCLLIMTVTVVLFTAYRCRKRCQRSGKMCSMRRSSSISYHPQRDEVSIMTVSEGTAAWKTNTHHGLGNKLYYALENVDISNNDSTTASLVANPL